MKTSRVIVAGIAGVAALGAFLMSNMSPSEEPQQAVAIQSVPTTDVLVATTDIQMGAVVQASDLRWQPFPKDSSNAAFITKQGNGEAEIKAVTGTIARYPFVANEPRRNEKLIQANGSGFLAAILPPGKRAVAINTEASGANTAGGFILPNDYVDVIRTYRDEELARIRGSNSQEAMKSEVVVSDVRVLAIGQNVQERGGEKFITSQTATLELDPRQTQQIILAQKQGALSLALRSIQDANRPDTPVADNGRHSLTVVRAGVAMDTVAK